MMILRTSVTRFGEISSLWPKVNIIRQTFLTGLNNILNLLWQKIDLGQIFIIANCPNIEKIIGPSGHTASNGAAASERPTACARCQRTTTTTTVCNREQRTRRRSTISRVVLLPLLQKLFCLNRPILPVAAAFVHSGLSGLPKMGPIQVLPIFSSL